MRGVAAELFWFELKLLMKSTARGAEAGVPRFVPSLEPGKRVAGSEIQLIGIENSHVVSGIWDWAPSRALLGSPVSAQEPSAALAVPEGRAQTVNTVDIW